MGVDVGNIFRRQANMHQWRIKRIEKALGMPTNVLRLGREQIAPRWTANRPWLNQPFSTQDFAALHRMHKAAYLANLAEQADQALRSDAFSAGVPGSLGDRLSVWGAGAREGQPSSVTRRFELTGTLKEVGLLEPLVMMRTVDLWAVNYWLRQRGVQANAVDFGHLIHELEPQVRPLSEYLLLEYIELLPPHDPEVFEKW